MKANDRLSQQVKNNAITITGKYDTKITFLGSSCPASVNPGDRVDSFSLFPGEEEVVCAVQIFWGVTPSGKKVGYFEYRHFLLEIARGDDGNPVAGLEHAFVPKPDRLGQIVPEVGLSVRIGEESFLAPLLVSSYNTEEKLTALRTQYRMVANKDANLLCRFIAGRADAEEVKAAAAELVVQTVDIPALQAKLAEAERQSMGEKKQISNLLAELKQVSNADLTTFSAFTKLKESYAGTLERLRTALSTKYRLLWGHDSARIMQINALVTSAEEEFQNLK